MTDSIKRTRKPGGGRKPAKYGLTRIIYVPIGILAQVMLIIHNYKEQCKRGKEESST